MAVILKVKNKKKKGNAKKVTVRMSMTISNHQRYSHSDAFEISDSLWSLGDGIGTANLCAQ